MVASSELSEDSLIKWFNDGADGAIDWGTGGDFEACVSEAGKHMDDDMAKGFCANRHHDATGEWPGKGAHEASVHERLDHLETAILALAELEFGGPGSGDTPGHPFEGNQFGPASSSSPSNSADAHSQSPSSAGEKGLAKGQQNAAHLATQAANTAAKTAATKATAAKKATAVVKKAANVKKATDRKTAVVAKKAAHAAATAAKKAAPKKAAGHKASGGGGHKAPAHHAAAHRKK